MQSEITGGIMMDIQDDRNAVFDENGKEVHPLDDDYDYYKLIQLSPLDDYYCKYTEDM